MMRRIKIDINLAFKDLLSIDKWIYRREQHVPEIERFCKDVNHLFKIQQNQK